MSSSEETGWFVGYACILLTHLWAFWLVYRLYHVRSFPAIAIRRYSLILLGVVYNFAYDLFWIADAINGTLKGTGIACGPWEFFDGIYGNSILLILAIRAWVLCCAFRIVQAVEVAGAEVAAKSKSLQDLKQTTGSSLSQRNKNRLIWFRRISSPRFMLLFFLIYSGILLSFFFVNWTHFPDLVRLSWNAFEETHGTCFQSWSYKTALYLQYLVGVIGLVFAFLTNIIHDSYKLRREISAMTLIWLVYWSIQHALNSTIGYNETAAIWIWVFIRLLFSYMFLYTPYKRAVRELVRLETSKISAAEKGKLALHPETKTLFQFLDDVESSEKLRQFLLHQYAAELHFFLVQVNTYEKLHLDLLELSDQEAPAADIESKSKVIQRMAKEIVENFLMVGAPLELNIETSIKDEYARAITGSGFAFSSFFGTPKKIVIEEMCTSFLPRFLATEEGKGCQKRMRAQSTEIMVMATLGDQTAVK